MRCDCAFPLPPPSFLLFSLVLSLILPLILLCFFLSLSLSLSLSLLSRYESVSDVGLEIFYSSTTTDSGKWAADGTWKDPGGGTPGKDADDLKWLGNATSSLLVSFSSFALRESVIAAISSSLPRNRVCDDTSKPRLLLLYRAFLAGGISTYAYLLLVNSAAGRSMKDLSRCELLHVLLSFAALTLSL